MLKKLILSMLVTAFITTTTFAKGEEVPAAVKSKFASLYPNVKKVKWEKEDGKYEAEFEENKVETSVLFDANGNLLETEIEIEVSALPKSISDYVTKNYAGQKITEASKITAANGTVTYEAEIKSGDLIFDDKGNFIKKKEDKEDEKDDDK